MTDELTINKVSHFKISEIDGEFVMIDSVNGVYYQLSDVGCRIFDILDSPSTVGELVKVITSEFDVDYLTCKKDTVDFIDQMIEVGAFCLESA